MVHESTVWSTAVMLLSEKSLLSPDESVPKSELSSKAKKKLVAPVDKPETSIGFHTPLSLSNSPN